MADRTLFPLAFGPKKAAPLWTAPAFDRCLLLALLYPIATIFAIWAISGHVGPAERALGLKPDNAGWVRSLWVSLALALWLVFSLALSLSLLLPVSLALSALQSLSRALTLALMFRVLSLALALSLALRLALALSPVIAPPLALVPSVALSLLQALGLYRF